MTTTICHSCRLALCRTVCSRPSTSSALLQRRIPMLVRTYSNSADDGNCSASKSSSDIATILSKPTWSVRSLLPPSSTITEQKREISPKTLHHLLRLSALPPPASRAEEEELLDTLSSQLHFVRAIQQVDTAGVEPLRSIRDETSEGLKEQTIGLQELKEALGNEDIMGHARRPRRKRAPKMDPGIENWDVLANAGETVGPYFVVRSGTTEAEQVRGKP